MQFTYSTLVAAIQQYTLEGTALENPDFASFLPTIIQLSEERIIRDLNSNIFDVEITSSMVDGDPQLAIPPAFLGIRYMMVTTDGQNYIPLIRKDTTWIENYWRNRNLQDVPVYYGVFGNGTSGAITGPFLLAPTPSASYTYRLRYIQRPASIAQLQINATPDEPAPVPDPTTTWLSTHAADCLLYACLAESMGYLREDLASEQGMAARFEAKYSSELQKLRQELSDQIITGFYF